MKKKIINGLLFAVALVAATSSFVSCKDYEGDDVARLNEELAAAKINAQTTIDELIRLQQAQIQYQINNLYTAYENLYNKVQAAEKTKGLQDQLDELMKEYNSASTPAQKMAVLSKMNALLMQATGTDESGAHSGDAPNATEAIIIMWGDSLRKAYKNAYDALVNAEAAQITANAAQTAADNAQATANQGVADAANAKKLALDAQTAANQAIADAKAAQETADKGVADAATAQAAADKALADAKAAKDAADAAQTTADAAKDAAAAVDQALKDFMAAEKLENAALQKSIDDLDEKYAGEVKKTNDKVDALTLRVDDIEKAYKAADEALQNQINELNELVSDLAEDIDAIKESLALEVTGIEIQATNNPIFGSFAYPIDVQSNILALYYGEVVNGGYNFPVGDKYADLWVGGKAVILDTELSDIAAPSYPVPEEGILMNEGAGNAGKLYLTVNPSNVNFEGKNFSLRTSDNQVSKVTLSGLEPCTEQLTWGYHRASSANGFYVATAEVKKNDVKSVALSFDLKGVSSQVQNIMQDWSKTKLADIAKLAATVAQNMKIDAPRLGVQAQWKDPVTGWKNYVSKYDLAAVSVRPLSFHDLYNADYSPAIVKLRNKLTAKEKAFSQELINEIKAMINVQIGLPATAGNIRTTEDGKVFIDINDNVTIPSVDFKTDESSAQITIKKGQFYPGYDDNGNLNDLPAGMSYIPTTDEKIKIPAVTGSTYPSSTHINTSIEITSLFNAIVDGIKKSLSGVNKITDKIEDIVNRIINIQNKIFGKVESVLKNPNRFLQPALFASKDNSFFYPSRIYSAPTKVKQGTKLMFYPSSLNAEIVAPAFKKYVAVCGAWEAGNIDNTTSAKKFNTGAMNTVFDGNEYNLQKPFEYTLNAPVGTVIEIIYECLGYDGKVAGKKYYIEVAE